MWMVPEIALTWQYAYDQGNVDPWTDPVMVAAVHVIGTHQLDSTASSDVFAPRFSSGDDAARSRSVQQCQPLPSTPGHCAAAATRSAGWW